MNTALANRLLKKVRNFPLAFEMGSWVSQAVQSEDTPCGAVGCLAGHIVVMEDGVEAAVALGRKNHEYAANLPPNSGLDYILAGPVPQRAIELLDITRDQAKSLFFTDEWPAPFLEDWNITSDDYAIFKSRELSEILGDRLETFIQENS